MRILAWLCLSALPLGGMAFVPAPVCIEGRVSGATVMKAEPSRPLGASRRETLQSAMGWAALAAPFVFGGAALADEPKYLKEPTPEFLEAQAKIAAFEKEQLEKKKEWKKRFAGLDKAATEKELVDVLDSLTLYVQKEKGLPVGIKKQGLITDIRKVKAKGKEAKIWNKDAEIAYEDLIQTVSYMISPNTQRDKANPL